MIHVVLALPFVMAACAWSQQLKSGPPLPHTLVAGWPQLPAGWNFGETSGVAVDKSDNVWVFNRGKHPVMQFDRNGKLLQAWGDVPVKSAHGIRVGPDGNIWALDVAGNSLFTFTPQGRTVQVIGDVGGQAGNMQSKDAFNRPTGIDFAASGDYYVSDGYGNSRVVKFSRDGIFQKQWGRKLDYVHNIAVDSTGAIYAEEIKNWRVQKFAR